MNKKNATLAVMLAMINALLLAMTRAASFDPGAKIVVYVLTGLVTLNIIWLLFSDNE